MGRFEEITIRLTIIWNRGSVVVCQLGELQQDLIKAVCQYGTEGVKIDLKNAAPKHIAQL